MVCLQIKKSIKKNHILCSVGRMKKSPTVLFLSTPLRIYFWSINSPKKNNKWFCRDWCRSVSCLTFKHKKVLWYIKDKSSGRKWTKDFSLVKIPVMIIAHVRQIINYYYITNSSPSNNRNPMKHVQWACDVINSTSTTSFSHPRSVSSLSQQQQLTSKFS